MIGPLKLSEYLQSHNAKQMVISHYKDSVITPYIKYHQIVPSHSRDILKLIF